MNLNKHKIIWNISILQNVILTLLKVVTKWLDLKETYNVPGVSEGLNQGS